MTREAMTARELRDALGPLAAPLAERAGWSRSAWDVAVHREKVLDEDERERYRAALSEHVGELQKIKRSLK